MSEIIDFNSYKGEQIAQEETQATITFMQKHPEIMEHFKALMETNDPQEKNHHALCLVLYSRLEALNDADSKLNDLIRQYEQDHKE